EQAELVLREALALEPEVEASTDARALPLLAAAAPDVVDAQELAGRLGAAGAPVAIGDQGLGSQSITHHLTVCHPLRLVTTVPETHVGPVSRIDLRVLQASSLVRPSAIPAPPPPAVIGVAVSTEQLGHLDDAAPGAALGQRVEPWPVMRLRSGSRRPVEPKARQSRLHQGPRPGRRPRRPAAWNVLTTRHAAHRCACPVRP